VGRRRDGEYLAVTTLVPRIALAILMILLAGTFAMRASRLQ
jgi:hypothetical protein